MKILLSGDLGKILRERGIVPENCRRIIIDVEAQGVVTLYYETFAEPELLDVITEAGFKVKE